MYDDATSDLRFASPGQLSGPQNVAETGRYRENESNVQEADDAAGPPPCPCFPLNPMLWQKKKIRRDFYVTKTVLEVENVYHSEAVLESDKDCDLYLQCCILLPSAMCSPALGCDVPVYACGGEVIEEAAWR